MPRRILTPQPGIEPRAIAVKHLVLTTVPPENSLSLQINWSMSRRWSQRSPNVNILKIRVCLKCFPGHLTGTFTFNRSGKNQGGNFQSTSHQKQSNWKNSVTQLSTAFPYSFSFYLHNLENIIIILISPVYMWSSFGSHTHTHTQNCPPKTKP